VLIALEFRGHPFHGPLPSTVARALPPGLGDVIPDTASVLTQRFG
jgi:hypothetical protein